MKMSNNMQENENVKQYAEIQAQKKYDINQSSEGRVHCRNSIGIEIPTGKLQRIQERILLIEIVLRSILLYIFD
jgi:hypothetical protein